MRNLPKLLLAAGLTMAIGFPTALNAEIMGTDTYTLAANNGQGDWQKGSSHKDWDKKHNWDNDKRRDCHRDPRRHFIPGYGNVLHRHVGNSCRVQILKQHKRRDNQGCIRLGDFWWCP